jgi:hypothetical protein
MAVGDMLPGKIPQSKIDEAQTIAAITLDKLYSTCFDKTDEACYNLLLKYYTAHLLYTWGFGLPIISSSVGDVSVSKGGNVNLGDKTGLTPYFIEFQKLLNCPEGSGEFVVTV